MNRDANMLAAGTFLAKSVRTFSWFLAGCFLRVIKPRFPLSFAPCESWSGIQREIFVWEHHHSWNILGMATGHKGFPICATRWGCFFTGARNPVNRELIKRVTSCWCWRRQHFNKDMCVKDNGPSFEQHEKYILVHLQYSYSNITLIFWQKQLNLNAVW